MSDVLSQSNHSRDGESLEIPKEWLRVRVIDVALLNPKEKLDDDLDVGFMPMSGLPTAFFQKTEFEAKKWQTVKKGYTQFKDGDAIFAKITPCFENSKAAVIKSFPNGWGAGSTEYYVLRPIGELVDPRLFLALVRSKEFLVNGATNMSGSVGHKRVPKEFVQGYSFPLMSLAEQKQIATQLDQLLAQVDTLKNRLDAIPNILQRFRQSVLAAAVSGKLTEEWRGENEGNAWSVVELDKVTTFQNGFAFKSGWFLKEGRRQVVKLGNIRDGNLALDNAPAYVNDEIAEEYIKFKPKLDDSLISMTGTRFKQDYGFAALVTESDDILINQRVGRLSPKKDKVNGGFLNIFLRSKLFRDQFFKGETGGVNQGNVGSKHVSSCEISVPTLNEQTEIVRRVEQLFTFADQIEQRVKDAQSRVNNLTQSILAKAFRGELSAQWREDNPELISGENSAEALLARIKEERERLATANKKTNKIRKKTTEA